MYCELVHYETIDDYRLHFERVYCRRPIRTFDGIDVRFRKSSFDHCFFETVTVKDDTWSPRRAERIGRADAKKPLIRQAGSAVSLDRFPAPGRELMRNIVLDP